MDLFNLLGKALSAKDWKDMKLIIVSVSVLSLQFQKKRESVSVFKGYLCYKMITSQNVLSKA